MIVQIDRAPDGSYYCTHVSGNPRLVTEQDDLVAVVEKIQLGPGVDFDEKLATDFVGGWLLTLIERRLDAVESFATRFDRVLDDE